MELSLDTGTAEQQIRRYHNGEIVLNTSTHRTPIIVLPDQIIDPWEPNSFSDIQAIHFHQLVTLKPQLVLIGTGKQLHYLDPKRVLPLIEAQIPFEIMSTSAACRTYSVLISEGRKVAACLIN